LLDTTDAGPTNYGPLVRGNRIGNNPINGMMVRGGTLTTNGVWDDSDITHVVNSQVIIPDQHSLSGTLRRQSSADESLVIKLSGINAGFTAQGRPLDISDRIGGALQVLGMPNHPVVMTSLSDATVGAGLDASGKPQNNTNNAPANPTIPTL